MIGDRSTRRVRLFEAEASSRDSGPVIVLDVTELSETRLAQLRDRYPSIALRIEAWPESMRCRHFLMHRGASQAAAEHSPVASERELEFEKSQGNFLHPQFGRQIHWGTVSLLETLRQVIEPHCCFSFHDSRDVELLSNKRACQHFFESSGLPVPEILAFPTSYDEVREVTRIRGRCFLKCAHGSGASGCLAFHESQGTIRCFTMLRWLENASGPWLYCGLELRVLTNELEIARIVDRICQERAHLEHWIPKATVGGRNFDLRMVSIGGRVRHVVARVSPSPFTNLNLMNKRLSLQDLLQALGPKQALGVEAAVQVCEQAARLFPGTATIGFDVAVDRRGQPWILEANPFGSLLPGVLHQGRDTYATEMDFALQSLGGGAKHGFPASTRTELC
ncbi:MAG: STM4014 family protein [Planctomycetales bacterium]|nr:STM4014 family protein [Planctomycetales bacterium]